MAKLERSCMLSAGEKLPVQKQENAKISENESLELCGGIERLRKLRNYVTGYEKRARKEGAATLTANTEMGVPEDGKEAAIESELLPELKKEESRQALKRKPKAPKVNPFTTDPRRKDHPMVPIPRPPRSVEIVGGDVLGQCECVRRNGLQHDCPKLDCRGTELCLQWPMPACQPSGLGVPIPKESRVKKPEPPNCELTPSEKELAEKVLAKEKRQEEVRLIEHARDNWKNGKQQAELQKRANIQKGFLKCKIHSDMYRLVPSMRNAKTQTDHDENLRICPCEELEKLGKRNPKRESEGKQPDHVSEPDRLHQKEPVNQESVRTSTTGIPTAKALKEKIKKP